MSKKLLSIVFTCFISFAVIGQAGPQLNQGVVSSGAPFNWTKVAKWKSDLNNKTLTLQNDVNIPLSDIEGSMYLNEFFIVGSTYHLDKAHHGLPMRYNAFSDEIEVKRAGKTDLEALHRTSDISCEINNQKFVFSKYTNAQNELKKGYLITLTSGKNYTLYERKSKVFRKAEKAKTSFHSDTPNKFVDRNSFYLASGNGTPRHFKGSKKELAKFFGADNASSLKSFVKENKMDLNQKMDLTRLVTYANSL